MPKRTEWAYRSLLGGAGRGPRGFHAIKVKLHISGVRAASRSIVVPCHSPGCSPGPGYGPGYSPLATAWPRYGLGSGVSLPPFDVFRLVYSPRAVLVHTPEGMHTSLECSALQVGCILRGTHYYKTLWKPLVFSIWHLNTALVQCQSGQPPNPALSRSPTPEPRTRPCGLAPKARRDAFCGYTAFLEVVAVAALEAPGQPERLLGQGRAGAGPSRPRLGRQH